MVGKAGRSGRKKDGAKSTGVALDPISAMEPPDWLDGYGREKWFEILDELAPVEGLLSNIDRDAVAQYCEAYNEFRLASDQINGEYTVTSRAGGGCYQNPLVGIKNKALERMRLMAEKLGMTPSSRASMKIVPKPKADGEMETFAKIYKMRGAG